MSWFLIIVLVVIGNILLTLEIVALPGFVAGVCGIGMIGVAVWQTFAAKGALAGYIVLLAAIALFVLLMVVFMKARTWHLFSLHEQMDGRVNTIDEQAVAVGSRGITVSRCAPAGKALINGQLEEVHSQGTFIDEGRPVEVLDIDGYKITIVEIAEGMPLGQVTKQ